MHLTDDQRQFRKATGLDLDRLVERHMGKDSETQIFTWISIVLGREYWEFLPGSFAINTKRGWNQYVRDHYGWLIDWSGDDNPAIAEHPADLMSVAEGKTADADTESLDK